MLQTQSKAPQKALARMQQGELIVGSCSWQKAEGRGQKAEGRGQKGRDCCQVVAGVRSALTHRATAIKCDGQLYGRITYSNARDCNINLPCLILDCLSIKDSLPDIN